MGALPVASYSDSKGVFLALSAQSRETFSLSTVRSHLDCLGGLKDIQSANHVDRSTQHRVVAAGWDLQASQMDDGCGFGSDNSGLGGLSVGDVTWEMLRESKINTRCSRQCWIQLILFLVCGFGYTIMAFEFGHLCRFQHLSRNGEREKENPAELKNTTETSVILHTCSKMPLSSLRSMTIGVAPSFSSCLTIHAPKKPWAPVITTRSKEKREKSKRHM